MRCLALMGHLNCDPPRQPDENLLTLPMYVAAADDPRYWRLHDK